jgi:hypothetical protein
VELRALCDKVPRTPPGPEGSNGTGITLGAADHPKFLSPPAGDAAAAFLENISLEHSLVLLRFTKSPRCIGFLDLLPTFLFRNLSAVTRLFNSTSCANP